VSRVTRIEAGDRVLEDDDRASPVDARIARTRRRVVVLPAAAVLAAAGAALWILGADRPETYAGIEDHFKYGSIGSEPGGSILAPVGGVLPPLEIFKVLPDLFPDRLPGGYASLGLVVEPGRDRPIGVSKRRRLGLDQAGLNCAVCHVGTVREAPGAERRIVLGMPAHQLDLQGLFRFLLDSALDERFTAEAVIAKIRASGSRVGPIRRWAYRRFVVPRFREQALRLRGRMVRVLENDRAVWGPGRVDTFNPYKALQFNWPLALLPASELIGAADFPSIWNQRPREGMQLHWDGNNDSVRERNLSAALGAGVTPVTVDHAAIARVMDWIWTLPPPPYPFPVDAALAARGRPVYERRCASCHDAGGAAVGRVTPIEEIGTDPHRLDSYTYVFAANQGSLYPDSPHRFTRFRKTRGYANQPLDGIWARAPYLHNGSVPALRDLLEAPEGRPKLFHRGCDVYDQVRAGFACETAGEPGARRFLFDTSLPGNGNGGHLYGVDLPAEEKEAVVEYMKTL
jgi:mono/diheme cytochrome c family protein